MVKSETINAKFYIERGLAGEYKRLSTQHMWWGYLECAKKNGIIENIIENLNETGK